MRNIGSGDRLARGAASATFLPPEVSKDRWNEIFSDFSLEAFNAKKAEEEKEREAILMAKEEQQ